MQSVSVKLPSAKATEEARVALRALAALPKRRASRVVRVQAESEGPPISISIPREAFELFLDLLGQMANGNAVTIVPIHAELTTQQAADMLNVSRPFLIGLLDEGKIPFRLIGSHRRVRVGDLLDYKEADEVSRKAVLDELAEEAQKHGLGY
jgi:excisionase family DNA binding protein